MTPSVQDTVAPVTSCRVIRRWEVPHDGVKAADGTVAEMQARFNTLPHELGNYLTHNYGNRLIDLNEIYLQFGQLPECIFADAQTGATVRETMGDSPCSQAHIDMFSSFFAADENTQLTTTKRRGIAHTLHRISLITHPMRTPEKVLGVAVRVGRAMQGLLETMVWKSFLSDLANEKKSLLLIGKPGVGKVRRTSDIIYLTAPSRTHFLLAYNRSCQRLRLFVRLLVS
jgi:stage III sporulation protein SpoIIIAA